MAGKFTLLIVAAMLALATNVAADPRAGSTEPPPLAPQPPTVNQSKFNRSAFDQFSLQDTSRASPLIFGSGSSVIDLQKWDAVTNSNQEGSEASPDAWRPKQPPKLNNENLFNNDSFHFSEMHNMQVLQPSAQNDCVDDDDDCTQNSGLPRSHTKIHSGNFNKVRKPLIGLSIDVPLQ